MYVSQSVTPSSFTQVDYEVLLDVWSASISYLNEKLKLILILQRKMVKIDFYHLYVLNNTRKIFQSLSAGYTPLGVFKITDKQIDEFEKLWKVSEEPNSFTSVTIGLSISLSLSLFYKMETNWKIQVREWINLFEIVFHLMILCNATKGLYNALMNYCGNITFILFAYQRLRLFWTICNQSPLILCFVQS